MSTLRVDFGIVTALPKEFAAMVAMLVSPTKVNVPGDPNNYILGQIPANDGVGHHNVIVMSLKKMGNNSAASAASHLLRSFKTVNDILMVGIAGGIPRPSKPDVHVRVGDIVVSNEYGVIQYDNIKLLAGVSEIRSTSHPPSSALLGRTKFLEANRIAGQRPWENYLHHANHLEKASRPDAKTDATFWWKDENVPHPTDCERHEGFPKVHYGRIGSANTVLKDSVARDTLQNKCDIIAVEMEGSGIADGAWDLGKSYILVRGICDYCDHNKSDLWQGYAAVAAAAYARALIESFPAKKRRERNVKVPDTDLHVIAARNYDNVNPIIKSYLSDVIGYTSRIDIKGIRSQTGASREAIYFNIEDLYTPLKTSTDYVDKKAGNVTSTDSQDTDSLELDADRYLKFRGNASRNDHKELEFGYNYEDIAQYGLEGDEEVNNDEMSELGSLNIESYDEDSYEETLDIEGRYFSFIESLVDNKNADQNYDDRDKVLATHAVITHKHLLVVGEPGGGKTTLLRYLAYIFASDVLNWKTPNYIPKRVLHLGLLTESNIPIPIFIRLASIANRMEKEGVVPDSFMSYQKYILIEIEESFDEKTSKALEAELANGNCIILLDGLDEVSEHSSRDRVVKILDSVIRHWNSNHLVVTSRHFDYQAVSSLEGFETIYIESFGKSEIKEFIKNWVNQLYPDVDGKSCLPYQKELEYAIISDSTIRKIAKNPVMLTCLCVVHWNERKLPEAKADLIAAVLRWLITSRARQREERGFKSIFAVECFKALSLAMTNHSDGKKTIVDISWAVEQLGKPFYDEMGIEEAAKIRREGIRFLQYEMVDSGIIEQAGVGQLKFWHLTFQEHYAAQALADTGDDEWWDKIMGNLNNPQWSEVLDHFAGCLAWHGRHRITLLVERILTTGDEKNLMSIASCIGVMGRIVKILEAYEYRPPACLNWEKKRALALSIFDPEQSKSVTPGIRISAAIALGQSNDPRINLPISDCLPIRDWEKVKLGKFLVTVKEYQLFVENDGYLEPSFWGLGWKIKQALNWESPDYWDDQLEIPTAPVVSISWFEATAYTNWLSHNTGIAYRLPWWGEWEMAAYNPQGPFPWGNGNPNFNLLNFDNYAGCPTPVGVFPLGASRGGHMDLYGNVWEWCLDNDDRFRYMEIRGGDFTLSLGPEEGNLYSAKVIPILRDSKIGFRVVTEERRL